jgi:hypothetical protein
MLRKKLLDELNSVDFHLSKHLKEIGPNLIDSDSEQIEDIRTLCNIIDWKITNKNSTVYILTTSFKSNQTICILNDVQSDLQSKHICEYG